MRKKIKISATWRVIIVTSILFTAIWMVLLSILLLLKSSANEIIGSGILFGGFIVAWIVAVFALRRKDPRYVASLLEEISHSEGQAQERLVSGKEKKEHEHEVAL